MFSEQFEILSIVGPHALEGENAIVARKAKDITSCGHTLWFFNSTIHCNPAIAREHSVRVARFLAPKNVGGAKDTIHANRVTEWSRDGSIWTALDNRLSPVTGRIRKGGACLKLIKLVTENRDIDLNSYCGLDGKEVAFNLTKSTQVAETHKREDLSPNKKLRRLLLTGELDSENPLVYVR